MAWRRIAGPQVPTRSSDTGVPGLNSLALAGALLMAGFAGLVWIGLASSDPDVYIRAVSGWLFFP